MKIVLVSSRCRGWVDIDRGGRGASRIAAYWRTWRPVFLEDFMKIAFMLAVSASICVGGNAHATVGAGQRGLLRKSAASAGRPALKARRDARPAQPGGSSSESSRPECARQHPTAAHPRGDVL